QAPTENVVDSEQVRSGPPGSARSVTGRCCSFGDQIIESSRQTPVHLPHRRGVHISGDQYRYSVRETIGPLEQSVDLNSSLPTEGTPVAEERVGDVGCGQVDHPVTDFDSTTSAPPRLHLLDEMGRETGSDSPAEE